MSKGKRFIRFISTLSVGRAQGSNLSHRAANGMKVILIELPCREAANIEKDTRPPKVMQSWRGDFQQRDGIDGQILAMNMECRPCHEGFGLQEFNHSFRKGL
jgi:hypothetical protein